MHGVIRAIIVEIDRCASRGLRFAIDGELRYRTGIRLPIDDEFVRRGTMAVENRKAGPIRWHAGRERHAVFMDAESQDPFESGAIQPAG